MRILVTGAAGWIGAQVVRNLVEGGHDVLGMVRPTRALRQEHRSPLPSMQLLSADLRSPGGWTDAVRRFAPQSCVHCAWHVAPADYLVAHDNIDCIADGLKLLDVLASVGCRRAVYVGTCAEYDAKAGYHREDGPTRPGTLYGAAKLTLSVAAASAARDAGIEFVWARLFSLYGPRENPQRPLPRLIEALLDGRRFAASNGLQVRDYLHVDDCAAGLCALALQGAPGEYNVCSGLPVQLRVLMETVETIVGRSGLIAFGEVNRRAWDPSFICGDPSKLIRETGWSSKLPLFNGLQSTVAWWSDYLTATSEHR